MAARGTTPTPAIETSLWRSRTFAAANVASLLYGAALFPWLLVGVLFLVGIWGYSPLEAGLSHDAGRVHRGGRRPAQPGRSSRAAGRAVVDHRRRAACSAPPGSWAPSRCRASRAFSTWWLPVGVLIGLGTGAITTGTSTAATLSVAPARFAAAGGLNQTARQVGGALGLAVLAALLDRRRRQATSARTPTSTLFCSVATFAVAVDRAAGSITRSIEDRSAR